MKSKVKENAQYMFKCIFIFRNLNVSETDGAMLSNFCLVNRAPSKDVCEPIISSILVNIYGENRLESFGLFFLFILILH